MAYGDADAIAPARVPEYRPIRTNRRPRVYRLPLTVPPTVPKQRCGLLASQPSAARLTFGRQPSTLGAINEVEPHGGGCRVRFQNTTGIRLRAFALKDGPVAFGLFFGKCTFYIFDLSRRVLQVATFVLHPVVG